MLGISLIKLPYNFTHNLYTVVGHCKIEILLALEIKILYGTNLFIPYHRIVYTLKQLNNWRAE